MPLTWGFGRGVVLFLDSDSLRPLTSGFGVGVVIFIASTSKPVFVRDRSKFSSWVLRTGFRPVPG